MIIIKFGGSSIGSPEDISHIKEILKKRKEPFIVVVSAFCGVTDQLQALAETSLENKHQPILNALKNRHIDVVKKLIRPERQTDILVFIQQKFMEIENVCDGIFVINELSDRSKARLLGQGELLSAQIIYEYLRQEIGEISYLPSSELIKGEENVLNATVDFNITQRNCKAFIHNHHNYIAPGFIASNAKGNLVLLGRGGSDYTASIYGYCVDATQIELWSDVNGMQNADPKLVKNSRPIAKMSYEEAFEMSYFGAKIVYPPAILPAMKKNIPVLLKNTLFPKEEGTIIHLNTSTGNKVLGVSSLPKVSLITVAGMGLARAKGSARRIFHALELANVNVILISQSCSEQSICIGVSSAEAEVAARSIAREFEKEIETGIIHTPEVSNDHVILAVIGDNMRHQVDLSGKLFSALGDNNINVKAIAQGASERNISVVIKAKDEYKAVNVIHEKFFQSSIKKVHLFVIGVGNVGQQFIDIVYNRHKYCIDEYGVDLRIVFAANSKNYLYNAEGLSREQIHSLKAEGTPHPSSEALADFISEKNHRNSVIIDNTASKEISDLYSRFFNQGLSVVTCNKVAGSSPLEKYQKLMKLVRERNCKFQYETSVGAALPIIKTIQNLKLSGDKIRRIDAVVSGSLNFIFNNYNGIRTFAEVVLQAQQEGYTEPDPRIDLSGLDVIRKILILAREAGYKKDLKDVQFKSFLPKAASEATDVKNFFKALEENEDFFKNMLKKAQEKSAKLKVVAQLIDGNLQVSLKEVTADSPFYQLDGKDNIVALYTDMYPEEPLIVKGAGAGAKVTASGVFSDLLYVANQR